MIQFNYPENVKELMNWDEKQYDVFISTYNQAFQYYKSTLERSRIYNDEYYEYLTSLFLVTNQLSKTVNSPKINNSKAVFLVITSFYLIEENKLSVQTKTSLEALSLFYQSLSDAELISQVDAAYATRIIQGFHDPSFLVADDGSYNDVIISQDLLYSTNPIMCVKGNKVGVMNYHSDPLKVTFRIGSKPPTGADFFDAMYKQYRCITTNFLKYNYKDRLNTIMELNSSGKLKFQF